MARPVAKPGMWLPAVGDTVKLVTKHALGVDRFSRIRLARVKRVTRSGRVYIEFKSAESSWYERSEYFHGGTDIERCPDHYPRSNGFWRSFISHIAPPTAADLKTVPWGESESRTFAIKLTREKQKQRGE